MGKVNPRNVLAARLDAHTLRLINSNAEILKKVNAMRPAPAALKQGDGDWCTFQNVSADEVDIHIYDEIGMWGTTAASFVDQLNAVNAAKINVRLNSPGGEVFDGIAIHSALMRNPAHITVHIDGVAASAASFIAMAGDDIIMARNATMMIHDASGLVWGNPADMEAARDLLDKLSDNIADMYTLQAGGTVAEWRDRMRAETWYTGKEALAAGLVDEITQPDEPDGDEPEQNEAPTARLSLAAFKYANRAEAPDPLDVSRETKTSEPAPDPAREPDRTDHDRAMHMLANLLKS